MKSFRHSVLAAVALAAALVGSAKEELNLFGWSEYIPQEVIDGFTKETGIAVNFETFASNEEMLAKLIAGGGNYDLIQPSDYAAEVLVRQKLLAKLDKKLLPNLRHIAPEFTGWPHDPAGDYTVPYMGGTVGIVINTEVVKTPVKGFKDLFHPQFTNRLVVPNDNREIVSWALRTLGLPINEITPEALARARPLVAEWVQLVKLYDSDSPKTALLNGDVDLGIVWSGEAAQLWNEDKKFRYVLPEEGAHQWLDLLAIPAAARHPAAAHQFIDYLLRPEVSKLISDAFPYTNPNLGARKLLTPEQLANYASYPEGATKLEAFRDIGKAASEIDRMMTDLRSQ